MHRQHKNIIEIKNLNHTYNNNGVITEVLSNINIDIKYGEFVAIVGASGSGKSTLLNIIGLMEKPSAGEYFIDGREVNKFDESEYSTIRNNIIGFIFQRYHLIPYLNIQDNIIVPSVYGNVPYNDALSRSTKILDKLGLIHIKKNLPKQLSGGQQQRVSVGRALMNNPKIILADEPTGALDSKTAHGVIQMLHELNSQGHTIIIVTHDREIASQAKRIFEIYDGVINNVTENPDKLIPRIIEKKIELSPPGLMQSVLSASAFSIKALASHKFRSMLSVLGIIIGICAVVTSIAIGEGSKKKVLDQISLLTENTFEVLPGESWRYVSPLERQSLSLADVELIKSGTSVDTISPLISTSVTVSRGNKSLDVTLSGVGVDYFEIKEMTPYKGNFFSSQDLEDKSQSIILDEDITNTLYSPKENVIGSIVKVNGVALMVVGVAKKNRDNKGQADCWMPLTSMTARVTGINALSKILLKADGELDAIESEVDKVLLMNHGRRDFHFLSNQFLTESINKTSDIMSRLIATIACISLIVGGVGIMNIMLVSVTERTQEIGIRLAIGARRKDILLQFLIESSILCFVGGAVGVFLSWIICFFTPFLSENYHLIYNYPSALLALISSIFTGVFFGFVPARNASLLQPKDALTRE